MITIALLTVSAASSAMNFESLDTAIERCERSVVLPIFADEMRRRSLTATTAYEEQLLISQERSEISRKRALQTKPPLPANSRSEGELLDTGQLNNFQLVLDDRQRALDDLRRLELLRREAVELKRQYFLRHCSSVERGGS